MNKSRHVVLGLLATAFVPAAYACGGDSDGGAGPGPDAGLETSAADSGTPDTATTTDASATDVAVVDTSTPNDAADAADASDAVALTNNAKWEASSGFAPDAACAAWTLTNTATPEVPVLASGVLTLATSAQGENMYYRQGAAELITPAQLVIEATMRLVSGSASTPSRAPAQIASFRYGNPLRKNILFIASGELFLLASENAKGPSTTVDAGADAGTDAFHDYRITVNTATHAIEVFRDNVSVLTGTSYLDTEVGAERDIIFGEASTFAFGVSEWKSVSHNAHVLAPCP